MSFTVTDAVESDAVAELKVIAKLNEDIDQLASDARDCRDLCPQAATLLDLAWFFTEEALREAYGRCTAGCDGKSHCMCCNHYKALKPKAEALRGRL